jgi:Family of unknown function (DUF6338)
MIPQTLAAVIAFLFLVAPGLTYELLRERRWPSRAESGFREASRVALASLLFSIVAILLLCLARIVAPKLLPDPEGWFQLGKEYVRRNYTVVSAAAISELIIACGLALVAAIYLPSRHPAGKIAHVSAWFNVMREWRLPDEEVIAMVTLDDGDRYVGLVKSYSPELQLADRELVLQGPMVYQGVDDGDAVEFGRQWAFMVIPASSIKYLALAYRKTAGSTAERV